ncbi:MAG: hypothetical protein Q9209_003435 [Squamulea sp. 1 TL-2023]
MSLQVPTWSEKKTLLARIENSVDEPPPIVKGKFYALRGGLYFKVPQKQWHQEYLQITWHKEVPEVSDALAHEAGDPPFELVCQVSGMSKDNKIGLVWRCWDQYESATYGQSIVTSFSLDRSTIEKNLDKLWKIDGRLARFQRASIHVVLEEA